MNRVKALPGLYVDSKVLSQIIGLNIKNLQEYIKSQTETYGVVATKLFSGVLSEDLKVSISGSTQIVINKGYVIQLDTGEILMPEVAQTIKDLSAFTVNTTYYIYIVPKLTSYEKGVLTFTNGSKTVTVSGGSFDNVAPFNNIMIDTSGVGNDGFYQVFGNIASSSLELSEIFTGTNETNLKWKIIGRYHSDDLVDGNHAIYQYDDYDIIINSNPGLKGFPIARVLLTGGGILDKLVDQRGSYLYKKKSNFDVNADNIVRGLANDITTLEEKAKASRLDLVSKDMTVKGFRSGSPIVASGSNNESLTIGGGDVYYDGNGTRIQTTSPITLDILALVADGKILPANNYLYITYVSPNSYSWIWRQTLSDDPSHVIVAKIVDTTDATPRFQITDQRDYTKVKARSFVSEGKGLSSADGEFFYQTTGNGTGKFYYMRTKLDGSGLEAIELTNPTKVTEIVQSIISKTAFRERIRFNFYPAAKRDNWFVFNGLGMPTIVGYDFKIIEWRVGYYTPIAFNAPDHSKIDYPSIDSGILKVTPAQPGSELLVIKSVPDGLAVHEKNSLLGIYFKGIGDFNKISVRVNNAVISDTDMNNDATGAPLAKFYFAEVTIENTQEQITTGGS